LQTPTSCVCGYANPSDNWGDAPNTLNRSLGSVRGEAGDILGDDIPGDANLVACNLGDVFRAVCGPVHGRLREVELREVSQRQVVEFPVAVLREVSRRQVVEFQVAVLQEVARRQVVVVRGVQSQVAGSVDRPLPARQEVERPSVDDSSRNHPQRHHLLVAYSGDRG
jgi:hypothetical protein